MRFHLSHLLALSLLATGCENAATCEDGNAEACASPGTLGQVRITRLDVNYDLSKPVYVNNRVPITFGITATSADPAKPAARNVAVTFSFVEANPSDPANPVGCSSSSINVEVLGDGTEQIVDGFIWPTTLCAELVAKNGEVNLQVDFDGGPEVAAEIGSDIDAPSVVFSEAKRGDAVNKLCQGSANGGNTSIGCVHKFDLEPTPTGAEGKLIDVRYSLTANSSVAVLPLASMQPSDPSGPAEVQPALVVQSNFVVNGRDPYISPADPALIPVALKQAVPTIEEDLKFGYDPAALTATTTLPGKASVSYTIRSASDSLTQLPLTIRDTVNPKNKVSEVVVHEVLPGTAHVVVHELYLEGTTLAAVSDGGMWANENNFVVRGCFKAEFSQGGNEGDANQDDCQDLEVVLVRESPAGSTALSLSFDKEFSRKLGGERIAIESTLSTQNRLDLNGVSSRTEGKVDLTGKIGKSFDLTLARAFADASVNANPASASLDVGVDAFGNRLFGVSFEQEPKIVQTDDFSASKSFTIGNLGFGFGPVTIGIKVGIGGTIGINIEDTLEVLADNPSCQDLLKTGDNITACGRMTRVTSPYFGLTGNIEGGIDLKLVKAGVGADLRFITTSFPLDTTLGWGLTDANKFLVRGDVTWDMSLEPLGGDVYIIGKVGFRRFAKTLKVNLFSFSSPTIETRLLSVSMGTPEELQ